MKKLLIVESPTKVRTISRYLGKDFIVSSSRGHIRDLPKKKLNVDVENDFAPTYEVIENKKNVVKELRKLAKKAEEIYLACDPDREGEAICWHLAALLGGDNLHRVSFNEITQKAIAEALKHPGKIDLNLVEAQQARRILDRLVGYKVSPLLWTSVKRGLSAGRVQSVALRLVVERELKREAFRAEEFWIMTAQLLTAAKESYTAELMKLDGKKAKVSSKETADGLIKELTAENWLVSAFKQRKHRRKPRAPFITSSLQQDASSRLGFSPKRTMMIAQRLYEGIEIGDGQVGLITYMRTDSVRISDDGLAMGREYIDKNFPKDLPKNPRLYKGKKGAQDAHEAIRPTDPRRSPKLINDKLDRDQLRLYTLIWGRFIASQMSDAVYDKAEAQITAGRALFSAKGSILREPGFLQVYPDSGKSTDELLPPIKEGDEPTLEKLAGEQKFTQPPARFKPASLVKEMEKRGIGRPSTYAATISTLQARDYVALNEKRSFVPTELGRLVNTLLVASFPHLLKVDFTAELEEELDEIARGEKERTKVLGDFYSGFEAELEKAKAELPKQREKLTKLKEPLCPKCGSHLSIKYGRAGAFLGCSTYPDCDYTSDFERDDTGAITLIERQEVEEIKGDLTCDLCGKQMVKKDGRYGPFLACTGYPDCKNTRPLKINDDGTAEAVEVEKVEIECPTCGAPMKVRKGKRGEFLGCTKYPDCRGILNFTRDDDGKIVPDAPVEDDPNAPMCEDHNIKMQKKQGRWGEFWGCPNYPKCRNIIKIKGSKPAKKKEPAPVTKLNLPCAEENCDGKMVARMNRYGNEFYACDKYPECKFSCNRKPVESECPNCGFPWREPYYKKMRCHKCGHAE